VRAQQSPILKLIVVDVNVIFLFAAHEEFKSGNVLILNYLRCSNSEHCNFYFADFLKKTVPEKIAGWVKVACKPFALCLQIRR